MTLPNDLSFRVLLLFGEEGEPLLLLITFLKSEAVFGSIPVGWEHVQCGGGSLHYNGSVGSTPFMLWELCRPTAARAPLKRRTTSRKRRRLGLSAQHPRQDSLLCCAVCSITEGVDNTNTKLPPFLRLSLDIMGRHQHEDKINQNCNQYTLMQSKDTNNQTLRSFRSFP